jgi:hypothetical protein
MAKVNVTPFTARQKVNAFLLDRAGTGLLSGSLGWRSSVGGIAGTSRCYSPSPAKDDQPTLAVTSALALFYENLTRQEVYGTIFAKQNDF